MKIYIMRHGQAAAPSATSEQVLTAAGQAGIEELALQLQQQDIHIDQVFHSEKARARQTAAIIASQIAPQASLQLHAHITPNSDPHHLIMDISDWRADTLVVSHLPFIPHLLDLLTHHSNDCAGIRFEPGTIICLIPNGEHWQIEWVNQP